MGGAGRGSRVRLSDSVAEENSAQKKNALEASSFASRMFHETVCQGGAHIDRKNSNSHAAARHIIEPEFLTLPEPAGSICGPECPQSAEFRSQGRGAREVQGEFMIGSKRMNRRVAGKHFERAGGLTCGAGNPILQAVNSQRRDDR